MNKDGKFNKVNQINKSKGKNANELKNANQNLILYDMEININSILGFSRGWDIKYSKDGKKQFEYYKRNPTVIYSIIGNKNRGKSFLLSLIADRKLPQGFSVTTKGLSISFPTFNNMTLLDSVGFESPLLESDGEEYMLKSEDEKLNKEFYDNIKKLKEKIKKLYKDNADFNDIRDAENEYFRERNNFRDQIKEKDKQINILTNERRTTDFFLQRFIVENANVILLVVGKLSIEDQFFLNKLTKLIRENNKVFLQKIIIIHNLMTMKEIKVVQDYIENTLKKSLTFTLLERDDLIMEEEPNKDYNKIRYFEEDKESSSKDIIHLIMAQEGSEAGKYYNDSTIDYIRKSGGAVLNSREFDIVERLKQYFCDVSKTIVKFDDPNEKIIPENISIIEDNGDEKLKLNYGKKLTLETFDGDLFTGTFGESKFNPKFFIVTTDPDYLKIYLDCPGNTSVNEIIINYPSPQNLNTNVIIRGKREADNSKAKARKFSSGDFEIKIILKGNDGNITKKKSVEAVESGFLLIKIQKNKN